MKSMIRMALLGLFVAAPSVMAKLPFRNAPNRLDGIYIQKVGLSSKEIKAINNGFGLWLQNTGTWRVVSSATDPDRFITVKVEKINGMNPENPTCSDPRAMACISSIKDPFQMDGTNASIKIYTKYMMNGVPTDNPYLKADNPNLNSYAFWTNFSTIAVGNLLGLAVEAGNGWQWTNERYSDVVYHSLLELPAAYACGLNQYLQSIGRATLTCTYNWSTNEVTNSAGTPILEVREYRRSDKALIARYAGKNAWGNGTGIGGIREGIPLDALDRSYYRELESAKWILGGPAQVTFNKGRIIAPNHTSGCYTNLIPEVFGSPFYAGVWGNSSFGKGEASPIAVQSTPEGDYFVKNATNGCAKSIGYAGAVTP